MSRDFFEPGPEYPDAAGHKGRAETSREAAKAINSKIGRLQKLTLDAIEAAGFRGLTADECSDALGMDRWSIQPRVSELKVKGLVVDSELRRLNRSGRAAVVWVTPAYKQEDVAA